MLTELSAEFAQVVWRTSTKIILRVNADKDADWIFYEEHCLNQVFCMIDHLIIQLTCPKFHFETETDVDSLTGPQQYKGDHKFYLGNNFQLEMRPRFFQQV